MMTVVCDFINKKNSACEVKRCLSRPPSSILPPHTQTHRRHRHPPRPPPGRPRGGRARTHKAHHFCHPPPGLLLLLYYYYYYYYWGRRSVRHGPLLLVCCPNHPHAARQRVLPHTPRGPGGYHWGQRGGEDHAASHDSRGIGARRRGHHRGAYRADWHGVPVEGRAHQGERWIKNNWHFFFFFFFLCQSIPHPSQQPLHTCPPTYPTNQPLPAFPPVPARPPHPLIAGPARAGRSGRRVRHRHHRRL